MRTVFLFWKSAKVLRDYPCKIFTGKKMQKKLYRPTFVCSSVDI